MSDLVSFLKKLPANVLGEALRSVTFPGEGVGCYENFTVRPDATKMTTSEVGLLIANDDCTAVGYTFQEGEATIQVVWEWDGDGMLRFLVKEGDVVVRDVMNHDCKKDDNWDE